MTKQVQAAILAPPSYALTPAVQVDGHGDEGAGVAELTDALALRGWGLAGIGRPPDIRVFVRRARPHPAAQLTLSDIADYRFRTFAITAGVGQLVALEAQHRADAPVEDRIRTGKDSGYGRFLPHQFSINAV